MKQLLLAASTTDSSGSSITEPAAAQLNALQNGGHRSTGNRSLAY